MWTTYAEARNTPESRREALLSFLDENDADKEKCSVFLDQILEDLFQETIPQDMVRPLIRVCHRLSMESQWSDRLAVPDVLKRFVDIASDTNIEEDAELQDYSLRAAHNVIVHNQALAEAFDEPLSQRLMKILEQPSVVAKGTGEGPVRLLSCILRLVNIALSRPWYQERTRAKNFSTIVLLTSLTEKLLPPEDTPKNSLEVQDELTMALCCMMHSLQKDQEGSPSMFRYAHRVFYTNKKTESTLLNPTVQYAVTLMACCIIPYQFHGGQKNELIEDLAFVLSRTTERYVNAENGEPTEHHDADGVSLEKDQAPLWVLLGKLAASSDEWCPTIAMHLFDHREGEDPEQPPTKPKLKQYQHLMSSEPFCLLSLAVGHAMYMISKKNACLGILFMLGEQEKIVNDASSQFIYDDETGPDEFNWRTKSSPADENVTAEQFVAMVDRLQTIGLVMPENPIRKAYEQGVLGHVEKKMEEMQLEELIKDDQEAQQALDEWVLKKLCQDMGVPP